MIYLHIIFGILLISTCISCLCLYLKSSPTTGHVVIMFHLLVFITIALSYLDIYTLVLRTTAA